MCVLFLVRSEHEFNSVHFNTFLNRLNPIHFAVPSKASLHTFRTLHWSGPNLTSTRRVGLALRYVRADVARSRPLRRRESATVAAGRYDARRGAFDVEMEPRRALGEEELT